jgi:hypothetical protein
MHSVDGPTPASFAERFRSVIRIGLNWDRFAKDRWPVKVVTLNSPEDLGRFFMPWYIGPDGKEVAYDDVHAVPLNLRDVPKAMKLLNEERRGDIEQYVDKFRKQNSLIEFMAPTYSLPNNQYFILDRNHRLSALAIHPFPFQVTLWNVVGPLDHTCLLDLLHWTRPRRPAS